MSDLWLSPAPAILAGTLLLGLGLWLTARLYSPFPRWVRLPSPPPPPVDAVSALWTAERRGDFRPLLSEARAQLREWTRRRGVPAPPTLDRRLRRLDRQARSERSPLRWFVPSTHRRTATSARFARSVDRSLEELDRLLHAEGSRP